MSRQSHDSGDLQRCAARGVPRLKCLDPVPHADRQRLFSSFSLDGYTSHNNVAETPPATKDLRVIAVTSLENGPYAYVHLRRPTGRG